MKQRRLKQDFVLIALSIVFAVWLVQSGLLDSFFSETQLYGPLESFIAGMFFTSAFTTAPAIAVLAKLTSIHAVLPTAFWGGLGALFGDLVLFVFVKDRFADDLMMMIGKGTARKLRHIFQTKLFRWFSPFVAATIIASPLPDELGVMMLGFARTNFPLFVAFSFAANFAGILAIASVAKSLL